MIDIKLFSFIESCSQALDSGIMGAAMLLNNSVYLSENVSIIDQIENVLVFCGNQLLHLVHNVILVTAAYLTDIVRNAVCRRHVSY